jgi:hypothetical protein
MESTCATRAVKVLKYLRREVPATVPRSSVDELEELPSGVLAGPRSPGNVSAPVTVGLDDWLDFRYLFAGRNLSGQNRVYAVPA